MKPLSFWSYAATAVTLGGLLMYILLDGRARRRELANSRRKACAAAPTPSGMHPDG
jgi:heme exporter protein CcmD